ncbi:MAG: hypothetical protein V3Q69_09935 [Burkholderia sp.]
MRVNVNGSRSIYATTPLFSVKNTGDSTVMLGSGVHIEILILNSGS